MKKHAIHLMSFLSACGVFVYTLIAGWVIFNGESIFGEANQFWGVAMMLMVFVVSATIVSVLMLGKPIALYLDGKKKDSIKLLLASIGWLLLIGVIYMVVLGILAIK